MPKKLNELLDELKTKVEEVWGDLTTIDVVTMVGTIEFKIGGSATEIDPSVLFKNLKNQPSGDLKVAMLTHVDFDLDRTNIIAPNIEEKVIAIHNESVKAAMEARQAVVDFVKSIF